MATGTREYRWRALILLIRLVLRHTTLPKPARKVFRWQPSPRAKHGVPAEQPSGCSCTRVRLRLGLTLRQGAADLPYQHLLPVNLKRALTVPHMQAAIGRIAASPETVEALKNPGDRCKFGSWAILLDLLQRCLLPDVTVWMPQHHPFCDAMVGLLCADAACSSDVSACTR